ncbi:phage GP46 family protein [Xanthobacter wiegelii]|uniref:phage GP46 family protein n=1 Tax=Xanthobacter wiegelii TaxID=3119913 RepID=UPI0037276700
MQVFIRVGEGCAEQPLLLWDSLWDAQAGGADWALAGSEERLNRGGLSATAPLATAVALCLFTDKRAPRGMEDGSPGPAGFPPRLDDGDPRGWWGDGIDVRSEEGEAALGSHLWLLERAPLTERTAELAKLYATEALAPLIAQQACARVDVNADFDAIDGRLDLTVDLYGRDGANVYSQKFAVYWRNIGNS